MVGFVGSRIFCLHIYSLSSTDIRQSTPMYERLERQLFVASVPLMVNLPRRVSFNYDRIECFCIFILVVLNALVWEVVL